MSLTIEAVANQTVQTSTESHRRSTSEPVNEHVNLSETDIHLTIVRTAKNVDTANTGVRV